MGEYVVVMDKSLVNRGFFHSIIDKLEVKSWENM